MGKNAAFKAQQRARHSGPSDGAEEGGVAADGTVDASFHTAEWHAARLASLTVERVSWEEWKAKQKEEEAKLSLVAQDEEKAMREYRAALDADRARRLGKVAPAEEASKKRKRHKEHKDRKSKKEKKSKDKKDKKSKDKSKKHKKHKSSKKRRRSSDDSSSGSDSGSGSSSSDSEGVSPRGKKSAGPVKLSEFFES